MSNNEVDTQNTAGTPASTVGKIFRFLLIIIVLGGSIGVAIYWLKNKPVANRRPPRPHATLVEVKEVSRETEQVIVKAMGTVVPAREVDKAARVSGQIVEVAANFEPGGYFKEGEQIVRLDPTDYELAVEQREADLTKAKSELALEKGKRAVAESEYELLGKNVGKEDRALLLREPQLQSAQAAVSLAEAALKKAKLDLERTTVQTPFNAVVQQRNVELGAQVSASTPLATLVGTDEYWVQVPVPVDQLKWIDIPGVNSETGSTARVYDEAAWGKNAFREGTVRRMMVDLEPQGRMARLLIAVPDPLCLSTQSPVTRPMTLGSYVRVEIQGKELPGIIRVPRTAFHDGKKAFVMNAENKLDIRELEVGWSCDNYICACDGLQEGDKLVISDLAAPVEGMKLRTPDMPVDSEDDNGAAPGEEPAVSEEENPKAPAPAGSTEEDETSEEDATEQHTDDEQPEDQQ